ncbi:MAG: GreA/GreB family elongation factor [Gammaproteobacteria bacterium]
MSRAFVKESEGDQTDDAFPDRPESPDPNYITPRGHLGLQNRVAALIREQEALVRNSNALIVRQRLQRLDRDLRAARKRLERAIVIDPGRQPRSDVRFGAIVELLDPDGHTHEFAIVGEDEACASQGLISWQSPLARSLLGKRTGDTALWDRPLGAIEIEVLGIRYPPAQGV